MGPVIIETNYLVAVENCTHLHLGPVCFFNSWGGTESSTPPPPPTTHEILLQLSTTKLYFCLSLLRALALITLHHCLYHFNNLSLQAHIVFYKITLLIADHQLPNCKIQTNCSLFNTADFLLNPQVSMCSKVL